MLAQLGGWIGGFVHTALVAGAALAAVPLIIHLLNRRRHKPLRWAAMRFVVAAHRRTRRRVQLENLLLLLLRMGAVALLALAIARPYAGERSPLAGLTESRRDLVVLVDGSASMGWREGTETVFERATTRARELVRGLSGARGDRVLLILCGKFPRSAPWTSPEQALALLDTFAVTEEPLDLSAALSEVVAAAEREDAVAARGALEVRLLSDLQRRSFAPEDRGAAREALPQVLDRLRELSVRVLVEDVASTESEPANLGLASVAPSARILGPELPTDVRVEVRNFGSTPKNGVRVALEVDGERRPAQVVDIAARGRAEAVFPLVFARSGEHTLLARVEGGDKLPVDNARAHVLSVPPPVRVLLVDGAPGAVVEEDAVGYLRAVLEPGGDDGRPLGGSSPFEPRTCSPEELFAGEVDLAAFDVVWAANVESLPAATVEALEAWVALGHALVVSLGDRVDPARWNARCWRPDGSGLLPAEILGRSAVRSRADGWFRVREFATDHPALAFFADERFQPLLSEIPIYELFGTRPVATARVLAALDDDARSALLLERDYDRGRAFLWTTTIDPSWTRVPESPATLVPLVHELLRYAASDEGLPRNLPLGAPLVAEAQQFPRAATWTRPDGARRALDGEPEALPGGRWRLPAVPGREVASAGLYRIDTEGAGSFAFAALFEAEEGDLARLQPGELAAVHPALVAVDAEDGGRDDGPEDASQRGELWRGVAALCIAFLVLESLWAAWIGSRRRVRA